MRILIISKGIPTAKNPQFGCFAMDQAKALQAAGYEVAIMFMNGFMGKIWKRPGFFKWAQNGIQCYEAYGVPTAIIKQMINLRLGMFIEKRWARNTFKKVIKDFGFPDIVHAHFLESMVQGAAIKERYPIKLVGTEHWSKIAEPKIPHKVLSYGNYAYPKVDRLICVSENLGRCVKRHFGKESVVIHNLIDIDNLQPAVEKTNNDKFLIVAVGSLIPRKGFDVLIKAISQLNIDKEKLEVSIFGEGPSRKDLQQQIDTIGLSDVIKLMGRKDKKEIYNALHSADLFVLSSRLENFSVAIIEATANGLPAVATLCGGVEEYPVPHVTKIPVDDPAIMAQAILDAYHIRNTVDRIKIQNETLRNFSPKAIIEQTEGIYNTL